MTQEQKDLLLKDLCGRLPYGVKICDNKNSDIPYMNLCHVNGIVNEVFISSGKLCRVAPIEDIKPYLFPLSSMTEEQEKELITITDGKFRYMWGTITNAIPRKNISEWGTSENAFINDMKVINSLYIWLLKNHFDIYGLIPKGLAEDATNLNVY